MATNDRSSKRYRWMHSVFSGALAILMCPSLPASAAEFDLKFSHPSPPNHFHIRVVLAEWAKRIETQSQGRVAIKMFPAQQLLKIAEVYDGVRSGVADIGEVLTSVTPGRFPVMSIGELPFMYQSAEAGSKALMDLNATGAMSKEFADVKVLYLHTIDLASMHTRKTSIRTPEDLKGLRMRFPSSAIRDLLASYGSIPVGIPVPQIYENLEKGVVDGLATGLQAMQNLRLYELAKHHLDMPVFTLALCVCMNKRRFEGLPADLQKIIMDNSVNEAARTGRGYDEDNQAAYAAAIKEGGHTFYKPSPSDAEIWRKSAEPIIEAQLAALEGGGVDARKYFRVLRDAGVRHQRP